jgi:DNA-directed RNA polymerase specialized sigma24 family protein
VLTAPEKIADIRSPEQFVRFLVGVARNKVAHAGRHMEARKNDVGREVRLDDAGDIAGPHPISRDPTPSAAAIGQERYEQLVDRPLERDRQIVELRSEGNTFDEVAEKLGIDERTARKVISRLKRMQQIAPRPPRSVPHVASRTVPVPKADPLAAKPAAGPEPTPATPQQQSAAPPPKSAEAQTPAPAAATTGAAPAKPAPQIAPTQDMPKVQGLE